ncbi:hypothetical protein ACFQH8_18190 [Halomicroarcula sp. GCM10025710]
MTALVGEFVLTSAIKGVLEESAAFPVWLPQFGTIGQTIVYYSRALNFVQLILIPLALMWLAYAYGQYSATQTDD